MRPSNELYVNEAWKSHIPKIYLITLDIQAAFHAKKNRIMVVWECMHLTKPTSDTVI